MIFKIHYMYNYNTARGIGRDIVEYIGHHPEDLAKKGDIQGVQEKVK